MYKERHVCVSVFVPYTSTRYIYFNHVLAHDILKSPETCGSFQRFKNLRGLSPWANYADRATAACRRS
jgi:hypothetical protein